MPRRRLLRGCGAGAASDSRDASAGPEQGRGGGGTSCPPSLIRGQRGLCRPCLLQRHVRVAAATGLRSPGCRGKAPIEPEAQRLGLGQASSLDPAAPGPKPCAATSLGPGCMALLLLPLVIVTVSNSYGCCIVRRVIDLHLAILTSRRERSREARLGLRGAMILESLVKSQDSDEGPVTMIRAPRRVYP